MKSIKYAEDVISGKVLAGRYMIKAAERFLTDLEDDRFIFDQKEVKLLNDFFNNNVCVPELGYPVPIPAPHAFWMEQLHGFKWKDTGLRRFTNVYIQVARKNFKTFYAAGNTIFELLYSQDPYPMIMQGANSRDQALICTDMTGKIIKASPDLRHLVNEKAIELFTYKKKVIEIVYETEARFGRVEAMPKDPGDGGNASVGIVDEFHESIGTDLLETIKSGQGQRREPLILIITSPGVNKDVPCYTILRKKSIDVLEGRAVDDYHLSILFELDDESEWDQIDKLEKSNPMMSYAPTLRPYLTRRINEAKTEGGSIAANIKIKNSGIWLDAPEVWIESEVIRKNNHQSKELKGREVYCGFDLAKGTDLNALTLLIPVGDLKVVKTYYWITSDKIKQNTDHVDYLKWKETPEANLRVQEGNEIEFKKIALDMIEILKDYKVVTIGFDAKYARMGVIPYLTDTTIGGIYEDKLIPVGQGYTLSGSTIQLEQWLRLGQMDLLDNPVLAWNFGNVVLAQGDKGDVYPSKKRSTGKIDGVSSLCTAVEEYLRVHSEPIKSEPQIILL